MREVRQRHPELQPPTTTQVRMAVDAMIREIQQRHPGEREEPHQRGNNYTAQQLAMVRERVRNRLAIQELQQETNAPDQDDESVGSSRPS